METVISRAYELTIVSSTISTRDIYKMRRKGRKKKEERYSSKSFPTLHVVGSANDRTTRSSIRNLDRFVENDPTALLSFFFSSLHERTFSCASWHRHFSREFVSGNEAGAGRGPRFYSRRTALKAKRQWIRERGGKGGFAMEKRCREIREQRDSGIA